MTAFGRVTQLAYPLKKAFWRIGIIPFFLSRLFDGQNRHLTVCRDLSRPRK